MKQVLALLFLFYVPFAVAGEPAKAAVKPKASSASALTAEDEAGVIRKLQERGPRDQAIEKAVTFLLSKQNKDGSFGDKNKNALTGMAVMALLSAGHTPDEAPHGPALTSAL